MASPYTPLAMGDSLSFASFNSVARMALLECLALCTEISLPGTHPHWLSFILKTAKFREEVQNQTGSGKQNFPDGDGVRGVPGLKTQNSSYDT